MLDEIARDKGIATADIEIWFADEARVGEKNKIARRWARRGTRPSASQDQRTASTYIFGAICPKDGQGAALVLSWCNTAAMTLHLAEIATTIAPGAGTRAVGAMAANALDRQFTPQAPNQKWVADFTYIWTAEGWLYVAAVLDLFSAALSAGR